MKLSIKQNKGFTLVEALVSVLILTMGLIPVFIIILQASNLTASLKNNLIASNLAQEGIEVVRALRDENWFNDRIFDEGLEEGAYRVEWNSSALIEEEEGEELSMKIDSRGLYNYSTGEDTNFKRKIIITKDPTLPGCNCEIRVVAEVTWPERTRTRTISVESHLYNWK